MAPLLAPIIMLVSDGMPNEAIEATNLLIRHAGHPEPTPHFCVVADTLEDIQLCADSDDPEIATNARLAFRSSTASDYNRVRYFLGFPGDVDESFRMPTGIRYCYIYGSDGKVTRWAPVAA